MWFICYRRGIICLSMSTPSISTEFLAYQLAIFLVRADIWSVGATVDFSKSDTALIINQMSASTSVPGEFTVYPLILHQAVVEFVRFLNRESDKVKFNLTFSKRSVNAAHSLGPYPQRSRGYTGLYSSSFVCDERRLCTPNSDRNTYFQIRKISSN